MTSSLAMHLPRRRGDVRRGYTLTEVLVVISIIVLVLGMAVPAFRYITGGRSIEAGQNLVAATLRLAREHAMNRDLTAGVVFYTDNAQNRTAMAIVELRGDPHDPVYPTGVVMDPQHPVLELALDKTTPLYEIQTLPPGIEAGTFPINPNSSTLLSVVLFDRRGRLANSGFTVYPGDFSGDAPAIGYKLGTQIFFRGLPNTNPPEPALGNGHDGVRIRERERHDNYMDLMINRYDGSLQR